MIKSRKDTRSSLVIIGMSCRFTPKMIPINQDISMHGVVGGMEVGLKPNCDLNLLTDNVKRNIDVMFIKH